MFLNLLGEEQLADGMDITSAHSTVCGESPVRINLGMDMNGTLDVEACENPGVSLPILGVFGGREAISEEAIPR